MIMANKTIKFYGRGFGATPASVNVVYNGVTVYTGTVPTVNEAPTPLPGVDPTTLDVLFTLDVPVEYSGFAPMSVEVTAGAVTLGDESDNYAKIMNPVFTPEQWAIVSSPTSTLEERIAVRTAVANPPLSSEDEAILLDPDASASEKQTILVDHNAQNYISSGPSNFIRVNSETKVNVQLNGLPTEPVRRADEDGIWYWLIPTNGILSFDYQVEPSFI